jgi:transcriptional regulator with XRE-family HTH domain
MQESTVNPIRALREARGLTMDDLAKLAGVSQTAARDVEVGRVVSLTSQWAGAVEAMGGDFPTVCEAYRVWRVAEKAAIAARLEPQA